MKKIFLISILTVLFLFGCSSNFETIAINEVESSESKGYVILDVREVNEFAEGHIKNSFNIPLSEIQQNNFGSLDKKTKYIVICRSGNRSKQASDILFDNGFNVTNVSSGVSSWEGTLVK